jgi:hypothetical protein
MRHFHYKNLDEIERHCAELQIDFCARFGLGRSGYPVRKRNVDHRLSPRGLHQLSSAIRIGRATQSTSGPLDKALVAARCKREKRRLVSAFSRVFDFRKSACRRSP